MVKPRVAFAIGIMLGTMIGGFVGMRNAPPIYETRYVETPVSQDGIVFIVTGPGPEYPVTVEFQTANNTSYTPVYAFDIKQNQKFVAPLNTNETYRVVIEDAEGR